MLKTRIETLLDKKLAFFNTLQEVSSYIITFVYYNLNKVLEIDINISKKFDFEIIAFYTAKKNALSKNK